MNLSITKNNPIVSFFIQERILPSEHKKKNSVSDKIKKFVPNFFPELAEANQAVIINEKAWKDIKKSRKIVSFFSWVRTGCGVTGIVVTISVYTWYLINMFKKPGGEFYNVLKRLAERPRPPIYFFPTPSELFHDLLVTPIVIGAIFFNTATLPFCGIGAVYYIDLGLKKLENRFSKKSMDTALEELHRNMTELAIPIKEIIEKDDSKKENFRHNLNHAHEIYSKSGFSQEQTLRILEPLKNLLND